MKADHRLYKLRFLLPDTAATAKVAASLAPCLPSGTVLTLDGDLGAGKTTFVRSLTEAMDLPTDAVSSPTFTIVQEYEALDPEKPSLYHFDVYRLETAAAFGELGLDEYFHKPGVSLIEWAANIREALPAEFLELNFAVADGAAEDAWLAALQTGGGGQLVLAEDNRARVLTFTAHGEQSAAIVRKWQESPAFPGELAVQAPTIEE